MDSLSTVSTCITDYLPSEIALRCAQIINDLPHALRPTNAISLQQLASVAHHLPALWIFLRSLVMDSIVGRLESSV
jgi:hypothetical protein